MEILKKIFFLLAFLLVASITIKFACNSLIGNKESIVYQLQQEDSNMRSTKEVLQQMDFYELKKLYQKEYKRLEEYKRKIESKEIQNDDGTPFEEYEPIHSIKDEIERRELNEIKYFRIGFYWIVGVIVNILGYLIRKKIDVWYEVTLYVLGIALQIYAVRYSCDLYTRTHLILAFILSCVILAQLILIGFQTKIIVKNS